ncbi:MAG: response regulator transcription factor [Candidatus Eisenbacteria bacterium]|uniref:Response regulator transcription factor n=1 Tax=Eiseniibacteriota bacterium TaxID=2212470 RepID=A0A937XB45_UNCEI|nr:response regulator transcription factor [Candidatus Eisenbacteria bacterium]
MKILVVDDDLELLQLIAFALRQAGYLVLEASDGAAALRAFEREQPDLVLLDYNLPRLNGLEILGRIRASGSRTPVMMLTVRSAEEDQVGALDRGADDYLTKPFSPRTLLARVRALLRRSGIERPATTTTGDLVLDPESQSIRLRGGEPVALTRLEFRLLHLLAANAGRALTAERLTSHIWGYRGSGDRQLLKQLVHRLRQKVERDPAAPEYLLTVAGVGYRLRSTAESD